MNPLFEIWLFTCLVNCQQIRTSDNPIIFIYYMGSTKKPRFVQDMCKHQPF